MIPNPVVLPGKTTIEEIWKILDRDKIGSVLIGKADDYIGIVTRKDLATRGRNKSPSTPAFAIMSRNILKIDQEADVNVALNILRKKKVGRLAVTRNGIFCGLVTLFDIQKIHPQIMNPPTKKLKSEDIKFTKSKTSSIDSQKHPDNGNIRNKKKFSVFISHINENKVIANKLKSFIVECFPKNSVDIFIAGDPDNIQFSEDWFAKIKDGIKNCDLMVILCTPESVRRPWINFEAGAATLLDKNVGPICFAGQKVGQMPSL
jgi:hypothetical protein